MQSILHSFITFSVPEEIPGEVLRRTVCFASMFSHVLFSTASRLQALYERRRLSHSTKEQRTFTTSILEPQEVDVQLAQPPVDLLQFDISCGLQVLSLS